MCSPQIVHWHGKTVLGTKSKKKEGRVCEVCSIGKTAGTHAGAQARYCGMTSCRGMTQLPHQTTVIQRNFKETCLM